MKKRPTDDLLNELQTSESVDSYIKNNQEYMIDYSLPDYLNLLVKERQIVKAEAIKRAELHDVYGYQLFSGIRNPSRDKLLCLCIGMELSLDEVQQALKVAGLAALYAKSKRDSMIIFGIQNGQLLREINETLYENKEKTLQ